MLRVKSALPAGQVALWEVHPSHPEGEVFIADEQEYAVAATPGVLGAVARNVLIIVPDLSAIEVPSQSEEASPAPKPSRLRQKEG